MHIALNGWFWDQPNTGSGQYIRRLVPMLRRIAPDLGLTLILPPHNKSLDLPTNVGVLRTTGPGGRIGKVWFEQRTFPKMVKQAKADIAHVPYWGPPLSSPAKLVTSILDVAPLIFPEYAQGLGNRLYVSLVRAASQGIAHAITISDSEKANIVHFLGLPADSISTTYLAVDDRYHPQMGAEDDPEVREKYDLPDNFVLYLGGFDVRKQVNMLLLAYTYVVQAQGYEYPLVLAGEEPDWSKAVFPDMRAYAETLNLTEHIQWIGYVDEEDKPSLYRLADVFVSPSLYEGFGLPVIEAMASGTPVVAHEIPVYAETLGDGAYIVKNARSMAGAIIALIEQQPLRDSVINQGIAQATRYSWRKTAQQTLEVYEKVMQL